MAPADDANGDTRIMSKATAAQAIGTQEVNSVLNKAVDAAHLPAPSSTSRFNAEAQEWWRSAIDTRGSKLKQTWAQTMSEEAIEVPSGWPQGVVYITQNMVATSVTDTVAERYVLSPASSSNSEPVAGSSSRKDLPRATHNEGRPETLYTTSIQEQVPLVIHRIDQQTAWCPESFHSTSRNLTCHPAAGSFGLFAAADMPSDTFIRPYLGVLHTKADADFYSTYDLSLCHDSRLHSLSPRPDTTPRPDAERIAEQVESLSIDQEPKDPTALYLDSRYWGNESRFVNDYRGIALKANVEFRSFVQLSEDEERYQMGLFAVRPIRKGQELVINYGKSFWVHYEQLAELKRGKTAKESIQSVPDREQRRPAVANASSAQAAAGAKLDPIQAMLQRSRMRVFRTAPTSRPPHQPPSRT
ncbi:SET domain protein [Kalmanozyma brasiliensis GHG001]|uniref:SET domain protein n=1 Tax=Kalmanozyma brasiliensis (strain GHG001) TaxID=1365824 RepID=UPI002867F330|nr:SET domain protein [Kalmanozyma brasiliensis GHG001]KAF6766933.1 SET domain protein [Kalmanozyma brasiliensis GHG001]